MSPRRVLVIGGTGFLGRRITAAFVGHGDRVAVLSRGQRERSDDAAGDVSYLTADRNDRSAFADTLADRAFDVVVDNIAFNAADVGSVAEVLHDRVGHYVLISSAAVYSDRYRRRPLREHEAELTFRLPSDAPNPFHPRLGQAYANGKREAEQTLQRCPFPWTALRPPVILGADDRTLRIWWTVQRLLDGGPLLIPEWGSGRVFQVAWADDVARAAVVAAGEVAAFGHAYNVAQAEIYTAESWIEAAAAHLGVRVRYVRFPEERAPSLGLAGYALPIAGRPFGHLLLDLSAIRCDLGFSPSPESEWLGKTVLGCAASPPQTDSAGYADRHRELTAAESLSTTWTPSPPSTASPSTA